MHLHWFRKTGGHSTHAVVGREPIRECRCVVRRVRLLGGYGYAYEGQPWFDHPTEFMRPVPAVEGEE